MQRARLILNRPASGIGLALAVGILLVLVALMEGKACPLPAHAYGKLAAPLAERRVCSSGCTYSTVQAAVDAAQTGDIIKVAAGTYTDIHVYPRRDVATTGVVTQVVYITKTVTIQGGYTTSNWTAPDPVANPTILNAQGTGRVLYITGNITPTIAGLRITQGSAAGLGGLPGAYDAGGGIYIITATATLSNNEVVNNTSLTGSGNGGGMYLRFSNTTLAGNTITSNTASYSGGGLFISYSRATLSDNLIAANTAAYGGGGRLYASPATFRDNLITSNTARIYGTALDAYGGGLLLDESDATLVNTVVVSNQADTEGSGLCIEGSVSRLLHTTLARNTGGNGSGIYVTDYFGDAFSRVELTNTILVSHTVGIGVTGGNTVTVNSILWFGTPITVSQAPTATVTVQNPWQGNPAFAADGYHLTSSSAAINRGVSAGVATDIDGELRDAIPDLGADEFNAGCFARLNDSAIYATVQAAVDASTSAADVVQVAGTCAGVEARPRNDVTTTGVVTQVVYLIKTLTIRGGYTTTNWTAPDPAANPTTLDAQGLGRVLYIAGNISPTIEGLRITGGNATGLAGAPWSGDAGGGVYVSVATATLYDNQVFNNIGYFGGGMYLYNSRAILGGNTIISNTAQHSGGGLHLYSSPATVSGNTIASNTAPVWGGGVYLYASAASFSTNTIASNTTDYGGGVCLSSSAATLNDNTFTDNTAHENGGGVYLYYSTAALSANAVSSNTAGWGGGVNLWYSPAALDGNTITLNTAEYDGGGLSLYQSNATLTNNVIVDNRGSGLGSGLYIQASFPRLLHTTIARNAGGDGSGVHVTNDGANSSSATLTNTILVSHTIGISVMGGNTATANGILWFGTPITVSQAPTATVTVKNPRQGNPAFAADGYHLTSSSAAINRGVSAGVATDIDGELRDAIPDLGADEYLVSANCSRPLNSVSISGPTGGYTGTPYVFTADVTPSDATTPVTYTWRTVDGGQQLMIGGLSSVAVFTWTTIGVKGITVTAENCGGAVVGTHSVTLSVQSFAGDAYEVDNTCAQAGTILPDGFIQTHNFHAPNDEDWVKFQGLANKSYVIRVANVGDNVDAVVMLYSACAQAPLASDHNAFGPTIEMQWTAPADGVYYLQVMQNDPSVYGDGTNYDLSVALDMQPPTAPRNVRALAGDRSLIVQWRKNPEPDVAGYRVRWGTYSGGPYFDGDDVSGADTTYYQITSSANVSLTNGIAYYVVVAAMDFSNNVSPPSAEVGNIPSAVADTSTPILALNRPSGSSLYTTTVPALTVGGVCTDTGHNLSRIQVRNITKGTEKWNYGLSGGAMPCQVDSIPLNEGDNQMQATVYDAANNSSSASVTIRLIVGLKGAVVIVGGHNNSSDYQSNINYATNHAYNIFRSAGFGREDIMYLSPSAQDPDGDGISEVISTTTPADVHSALQWAATKVGPGSPFYLYLMDHGNIEYYCADGCTPDDKHITSLDLDIWLDELEATSGCDQVTVIIEACHSGSFTDKFDDPLKSISKENRVVIASTGRTNNAYASAQGAYFSDAFFSAVATSKSLQASFDQGKVAVEATPFNQTPWLDDNGDGLFNPADGAIAANRYIASYFGGLLPEITTAVVTVTNGVGTVQAFVQQGDEPTKIVWAAVYAPSFHEPTITTLNLGVPLIELSPDPTQDGLYTAHYNAFGEPGVYRVIIYAQDQAGNQALPKSIKTGMVTIYLPVVMKR